jgi:hypothetical protein
MSSGASRIDISADILYLLHKFATRARVRPEIWRGKKLETKYKIYRRPILFAS